MSEYTQAQVMQAVKAWYGSQETTDYGRMAAALRTLPATTLSAREDGCISVRPGEFLFQFDSFEKWVKCAREWFEDAAASSRDTICVDAKGRLCDVGREFIRARDDNAFPIRVYRTVISAAPKAPTAGEGHE